MTGPALAIMSRVPSPGGKSRLGCILTPEQREELQWAFLLDTLDKVKQLPEYKIYIAATPAAQTGRLAEITGPGVEIITQPEGDLGRRMLAVIRWLFHRGHGQVVLIGTDTPALRPAHLQKAMILLERYRLVLGPAEDGGYYLIGMNHPEAGVFENIPWGTSGVLPNTLAFCVSNNLTYGLLDCLRDIDRPADLAAVAEQLERGEIATPPIPSRTVQFLQRYFTAKG